jgi:uncharacterized membrane protein YphA (DoxX/SURF4 family)
MEKGETACEATHCRRRIMIPARTWGKRAFMSPWLSLFIRLGLAFIFIYAGGVKLLDPKAFARTISSYDLLPEVLLPVFAFGLPILEVVSGIALALDLRGGLTTVTALLTLFVCVLGYGVVNDMNIDCGCFGSEELAAMDSLKRALFRDIGFMGAAGFLYASRTVKAREALIHTNNPQRRYEDV